MGNFDAASSHSHVFLPRYEQLALCEEWKAQNPGSCEAFTLRAPAQVRASCVALDTRAKSMEHGEERLLTGCTSRQGKTEEFNLGKRSTFVLCNLQGPGVFSTIHYYYYDHYEQPVVNEGG